jgi:uncharacterized membrane protein
MADDTKSFLAWRKKKSLLLKISFALILAGFALGYTGGVNGSTPLIACAFALWGAAGTAALLVKS